MNIRFLLRTVALVAVLGSASALDAQTPAGRPFDRRDAFVLAFPAPYQTIRLDLGENPISTDFVVEARLDSSTVIEDARGKRVGPEAILPGMEVAVRGEAGRAGAVVTSLRLRTRLESWAGEADGVLDRVEGGVGVIEGRRVVMAEGRTVEGEGPWRRRTFTLDEIPLGSWVELHGRRGPDGTLVAEQGKARPNEYSNTEREIHDALRRGLVTPPAGQLAGAKMRIGEREFALVPNLALQSYVTRVGMRLIPAWMDSLAENDPARITYRFYVIEDSTFNAAAYPDGTVIVHTGLLRVVTSEAQLAAVLGHEIGHVTHEHGRRRLEDARNRAVGGLLVGAVIAQVGGNNGDRRATLDLVASLGLGAMANSYSRDHESQADRVGLAYMVAAGYDPREAAAVWRRLAEANRAGNAVDGAVQSAQTFLFSSHPAAMSRVRNINREIAANYSALDFTRLRTGEAEYRQAIAVLGRR